MKQKRIYWYMKRGLKQVSGFVTLSQKEELKKLAKSKDLTLQNYVGWLLKKHIHENKKPLS